MAQAAVAAAGNTAPWLSAYPPHANWSMPLNARPVQAMLAEAVKNWPQARAIHFLGGDTNYASLGAQVARFAAGLQKHGVTKGSRIGLFLPNCPAFVVAYYGILTAGGTVVNFSPLYSIEELDHQIRDSGIDMMVSLDLTVLFSKVETLLTSGSLKRAVIVPFADQLPWVKAIAFKIAKRKDVANVAGSPARTRILTLAALTAGAGAPTPVIIDPARDIAVLQYTGGTTGTPKGAMLTHANLTCNAEQIVAWAGNLTDGGERWMGVIPLFHVFAMTTIMNFSIRKAGCMILVPKFEINETLRTMQAQKPTVMPGVPTLFNALLNHENIGNFTLSSLKFCISGGAALPLEVKHKFEAKTGAKLVEGYGLSETSPVATCNPTDGLVKEGSIGQPLPQTTISIRSLEDSTREMPMGESGEICIAGPQVMPGYWQRPEETAATFTGEFFRTGDIGYLDADGYVFIVDRLKDMINASGFKVYPRRVEEAIYEHPAVEECTVIGIPDAHRGEAPKAFVKLKPGQALQASELLAFVRPKLSKVEIPAEVEFRDALPKTAVGKLSKKELKAEEAAKRQAAKG
jgi:long-chain acyl-CoA synthetase